jgi:hypothetical protein
MAAISSSDWVEQRLRVFEIGSVEPLGEPAVDRRQQIARFGTPALLAPQPREAGGGAQLQGLRLLLAGHPQGLLQTGLAFFEPVLRS